jgi:hypothetical protein
MFVDATHQLRTFGANNGGGQVASGTANVAGTESVICLIRSPFIPQCNAMQLELKLSKA